jgi:hypothetical protein
MLFQYILQYNFILFYLQDKEGKKKNRNKEGKT